MSRGTFGNDFQGFAVVTTAAVINHPAVTAAAAHTATRRCGLLNIVTVANCCWLRQVNLMYTELYNHSVNISDTLFQDNDNFEFRVDGFYCNSTISFNRS